MTTTNDDGLFAAPKPKRTFGPVYTGVTKQIRALIADGTIDKKLHAGTIAQARSLASSIDRDSGHGDRPGQHRTQANGVPLAALHQQLDALIERMTAGSVSDPFADFLASLDEGMPDGAATAPHPEV